MEMCEEIYANAELTEDKRVDSRHSENSYEDVYANQDNLETQRPRNFKESENSVSGMNSAGNKCYRLTAVCVVLLYVLLLMVVTLLWIKLNNMTTERHQLQTSYNNLTVSRDQLETSYGNLTKERDQLQKQKDEFWKLLTNLGWKWFASKPYYVSNEKKNWTESRQECREKGLDLLIINSKEEQEFVENLSRSKNYGIYIGLSDGDTEGVWKWVDGTSMTTAYWASGNGFSENEDCVVNRYNGRDQWYDRPCTEPYYWMCE